MSFQVIPAIDIREGRCVRLLRGDFTKETVFSDDPAEVSRRWQDSGAQRIHIVDLDGAASGRPTNAHIIREIASLLSVPVQVGGGLRSLDSIYKTLSLGVERVVLGTAAVKDPALLEEASKRFGEAIIVGMDARNGMVATHGWKQTQEVTVQELTRVVENLGIRRLIYTDISKDGAMEGPNFDSIGQLLASTSLGIIGSGGVCSLQHLKSLAQMGLEGAIVGRAIYTGDVDLAEAIAATSD